MKRALRWLAVLVVVFAALVVAFRTFKQIRPLWPHRVYAAAGNLTAEGRY